MINKIVKTRKAHICNECKKKINKGENAMFLTGREPVFEDNDDYYGKQIGIKYFKLYYHFSEKKDWPSCLSLKENKE